MADAAEAITASPDADLIRVSADRIAILDAIAANDGTAKDEPIGPPMTALATR